MIIQPYYIPIFLTSGSDSNYNITFGDILIIVLVTLFVLFIIWFFIVGIYKIKNFIRKF